MEINPFYLAVFVGIVFFVLLVWIVLIERRLRKIFRGNNGNNLEGLLVSLGEDLEKLNISRSEIEKYLQTVEKRLKRSIQNVNTLRFNPFETAGSNQSFAISFLDEKGDGVVVSSLYSREGVRVYAKPVQDHKSEYTLSDEEKEVINTSQTV